MSSNQHSMSVAILRAFITNKDAGESAIMGALDDLVEQNEAQEKALREMHEYLSGIVAFGFVGEADWDDINSWLTKHERYATYASNPAKEPQA